MSGPRQDAEKDQANVTEVIRASSANHDQAIPASSSDPS